MRQLRMLAACEMSGRVAQEFAGRGWEAWSADLLPSEELTTDGEQYLYLNGGVYQHYQGDVRDLFSLLHPVNAHRIQERDPQGWSLPLWDLVIAFPPCTDLSYAGARWFKEKQANGKQDLAREFFLQMIHAPSPMVAVENPRGIMMKRYRDPDQTVQPWWFGDAFYKNTCLWLKNLPLLEKTNVVQPTFRVATGGGSWRTDKAAERAKMSAYEDSEGRKNREKVRSRTFPGFAKAMADQWGEYAEDYYAGNCIDMRTVRDGNGKNVVRRDP